MSTIEQSFQVDVQGATLRGVLHLPSGAGPFPTVLWLPGFGGTRVEAHRLFVDGARLLAKQGVASLRVDYRGTGESDGDSLELTIASQVEDARAALSALRDLPEVDASRLGVLGFSLGAAIASQLREEDGVAAMVVWNPVVFPVPIFARMGLYAAHPEIGRQGWIDANGRRVSRDFLAQLSALDPLGVLAGNERPLLVLYGGEDMVVTRENAEALIEELPHAEGECFPGANHVFGSYKSRTWVLERSSAWLTGRLVGAIAAG